MFQNRKSQQATVILCCKWCCISLLSRDKVCRLLSGHLSKIVLGLGQGNRTFQRKLQYFNCCKAISRHSYNRWGLLTNKHVPIMNTHRLFIIDCNSKGIKHHKKVLFNILHIYCVLFGSNTLCVACCRCLLLDPKLLYETSVIHTAQNFKSVTWEKEM